TVTAGLLGFNALANLGSGPLTLAGGGLLWAPGNTFDITSSAQFNRNLGGAAVTFDTGGNNVTLSGSLSGSATLTKQDTGTLTLAGANTYAGGTQINGGLVGFSTMANFGPGIITINGGGLQWASGSNV